MAHFCGFLQRGLDSWPFWVDSSGAFFMANKGRRSARRRWIWLPDFLLVPRLDVIRVFVCLLHVEWRLGRKDPTTKVSLPPFLTHRIKITASFLAYHPSY